MFWPFIICENNMKIWAAMRLTFDHHALRASRPHERDLIGVRLGLYRLAIRYAIAGDEIGVVSSLRLNG